MKKCKKCKGYGYIYKSGEKDYFNGIIVLPKRIQCPKCQGRGHK